MRLTQNQHSKILNLALLKEFIFLVVVILIFTKRKRLGEKLVEPILKTINYDIEHTVFSFIPNTAEVAFYGLLEGFDNYLNEQRLNVLKN